MSVYEKSKNFTGSANTGNYNVDQASSSLAAAERHCSEKLSYLHIDE